MLKIISLMATGALLTAPIATTQSPQTPVTFTVSGHHGHHCVWRFRGKKDAGFLEVRLIKDTCPRTQMRLRVAGVGVVRGFVAGNWIDKNRQLSSINIAPDVYADFGYDIQYHWRTEPEGRVRFISLDNGAGLPIALTSAYSSHPSRPFTTVTANPWTLGPNSSGGESVYCPAGYPQPINAAVSALIANVPQFLPVGNSIHGRGWQVQAVNSTTQAAVITVTVICGR